jgi:hypothetical protein
MKRLVLVICMLSMGSLPGRSRRRHWVPRKPWQSWEPQR